LELESCPVFGTDLRRSLRTVRQEFQFPIDFEADHRVSFKTSDKEKKLFANNFTDLLRKSREIYLLLIAEHQVVHREYRNGQIDHTHQFKITDIVLNNVQIQSKAKTEAVAKLAYIK
jgi:predicted nucleic acid-binding protein